MGGIVLFNGRILEDREMKKIALATAFALTASTAFAGGLDDPIVEEPIIAETSSSAGGVLVPVLFLIFAAAVAS
jgi:hypothetical protein